VSLALTTVSFLTIKRIDLNYMMAHRRLPLADPLRKIGITKDNKCRLCQIKPETLQHLFLQCEMITNLKDKLEKILGKTKVRSWTYHMKH